MNNKTAKVSASAAFRFVLVMGLVNLFGDVTYEGGAGRESIRSARAKLRSAEKPSRQWHEGFALRG